MEVGKKTIQCQGGFVADSYGVISLAKTQVDIYVPDINYVHIN